MFDLGEITRAVSQSPVALPAQTRSNEEARQILSRRYKSHAMQVTGDERDFDFLHASAKLGGCSFNILRYGAGVAIDPGDFDAFYMLEIPLAGGVELHFNDRVCVSGSKHGLIISPGRPLTSVWQPGTIQMMLKIDKSFVVKRMRALTERPVRAHPMFEPVIALAEPQGWRIESLMTLLMQDLLRSITGPGWDFSKSPLATSIVDALLTSLPHDQSAAMSGAAADILPRHVKRAVRYIDQHFAEEVGVPLLAEIAESSERSLYEGFRNFLHVSPQHYLTEVRLKAARDMLLAGGQQVAAVARLCGFRHLGRFASLYRERYQEYPSETARH